METFESYQERVIDEKNDLEDRLVKLKNFLSSDMFHKLNDREKDLLSLQYDAMSIYNNILEKRIAKWMDS